MTVGIAAICRNDDDPHVLVAADRMVTFGQQGGIEYEDTASKIIPVVTSNEVTAVGLGAGLSTYIDEIHQCTQQLLSDPNNQAPTTLRDAMDFLLTAYKVTVRETITNQVTAPLGYTLDDLRDQDVDVPEKIQESIAQQARDIREEAQQNVRFLLAGVGADGAGIFQVSGMDYTNFTDMGYSVVGSGSDSARLTFIRRRYDEYASYREGVFTVLEAKDQAEERQGVGQDMDLVSIGDDLHRFDTGEKETLRQKLHKIEAEEREARKNVMEEWDRTS